MRTSIFASSSMSTGMAKSGKSGAPSSSIEAILGTVMMYCVPLGVATAVWRKPSSENVTVVVCSVLVTRWVIGATGRGLVMGIHCWATALNDSKMMPRSMVSFFMFLRVVFAGKGKEKRLNEVGW